MHKMNFNKTWRNWIKGCVEMTSASVLVNGSPTTEFKLEKGPRQGDSLSPFLFLIIAEGLNMLMERAVALNMAEGASVGKDKVIISHLQYADDTIFACSGKTKFFLEIKRILRWFELVSGLKVNFDKSSLWGINIDYGVMENLGAKVGCEVEKALFSYLGLNVGFNHRNSSTWNNLVEKVKKKLAKWNWKHISFAGRI
ncbi:hypothetical protein ACS0TY_032119 [Phlomoides rotata]